MNEGNLWPEGYDPNDNYGEGADSSLETETRLKVAEMPEVQNSSLSLEKDEDDKTQDLPDLNNLTSIETDHFFALTPYRAEQRGMTNGVERPSNDASFASEHLAIVCDGMGASELSGKLATKLVGKFRERFTNLSKLPSEMAIQDVIDLTLNEFAQENREELVVVASDTAAVEEGKVPGSTLTASIVLGDEALVIHIGDSVAHLFSKSKKSGVIVDRVTGDHFGSTGLQRCLSTFVKDSSVDVSYRQLDQGDLLMQYSDGFEKYFLLPLGMKEIRQSDPGWQGMTDEEVAFSLNISKKNQISAGVKIAGQLAYQALEQGKNPAEYLLSESLLISPETGQPISAREYAREDALRSNNKRKYHDDITLTILANQQT